MSLESNIQDLVSQTNQLDSTIKSELIDISSDFSSIRSRLAVVEGALGTPELRSTSIPNAGGGTTITQPTTSTATKGNDVIKIDPTASLVWLWNPSSNSWVSIPFTTIAPAQMIDVQAIINQANTAIDAGLEARLTALAASITETVLDTQQTQIDGLASTVSTLGTTVSGHTSAIATESTARASGDSALASQITDLVATVGANETAFLSFQAAVAADPTSASAQLLNTMQTQIGANTSAIQSETATRTTQNTSLASQVNTLSSSISSAQAAIVSEATARANADSALTTTTQSLAAQLGTAQGAITNLQSVTAGLNSNTVSNITTLTSQVGALNTTVQDVSSAVNGISGKRSLSINANGQVTGIELLGGGATGSQIKFQASNLVVYDPSTGIETVPFAISGGSTYINKAVIKNADIDTLKIAGNAVTQTSVFNVVSDITNIGATPVTVVSGTITVTGTQPILMLLSSFVGGAVSNGYPNAGGIGGNAIAYIGSYQQAIIPSITVQGGILTCATGAVVFTDIPAGTYTCSVKFTCENPSSVSPGFLVRNPKMIVLETKR